MNLGKICIKINIVNDGLLSFLITFLHTFFYEDNEPLGG